jgi:hypothetical protein
MKNVLLALSNATLPIFLGLQGGEPTLTPNYFSLLDKISKIIAKNSSSRCYITTNATKQPSWWEKHKEYEHFYVLWSFHPHYHNMKTIDNFLKSVEIMYHKGFKTKVNLMLVDDPHYWDMINDVRERLLSNLDIEVHPHYLYPGGDIYRLYPYSKRFWDYWSMLEDETYTQYVYIDRQYQKHLLNEYTIFRNNLTNFRGWACWNNNYEILTNGEVIKFCCNEKQDINEDISFFERIEKIYPIICQHSGCFCDGLAKVFKTRYCN